MTAQHPFGVWLSSAISFVAIVVTGAGIGLGFALHIAVALATVATVFAIVVRPIVALRLFLVGLPFLMYLPAFGQISLFVGLPLGLAIALALLGATFDHDVPAWQAPALAFLILLLVEALSALASVDVVQSMTRIVYFATFGLFAWAIGRAIAAGLITQMTVLLSFVLGASLSAIALLGQFALQFAAGTAPVLQWLNTIYPAFGGSRAADTSLQNWLIPNLQIVRAVFPFMAAPSAGQYMMLAVIAAVFLLRQRTLGLGRHLLWLNLALVTFGMIATISRQAWVGALVGVTILLARERAGRVLVVAAVLALLLLAVQLPGTDQALGSYLLTSADTTNTTSSSQRIVIWQEALDQIREGPLLGVGPGLYITLSRTGSVYYAHNVVLDFFVETGPIGGVAFVLLALLLLRAALRAESAIALPLLAAYFTANMFDDVFYFPKNGFALAAIVALACVRSRAPVGATDAGPVVVPPPRVGSSHAPRQRVREPVSAMAPTRAGLPGR